MKKTKIWEIFIYRLFECQCKLRISHKLPLNTLKKLVILSCFQRSNFKIIVLKHEAKRLQLTQKYSYLYVENES